MEAEKCVLGCILLDENKLIDILDIITADDFTNSKSKKLFELFVKMNINNEKIDLVSISQKGYDIEALVTLTELISTTEQSVHYAKLVKENSQRLKIIGIAQKMISDANNNEDIEEIITTLEKKISTLNTTQKQVETIENAVLEEVMRIEERTRNKGQFDGVPTGFVDLDFKLKGLKKGDLIIVAARPSMGKSLLAQNISLYAAAKQFKIGFFSIETTKSKLINRCLTEISHVPSQKIENGDLKDGDWNRITEASTMLTGLPIIIDDESNIKASSIRSKSRKIKKMLGGLDLIVVDHLTEMWRPKKGNDVNEHEENIRALKRIAKEMDCPLILLQQLNRQCEQRTDKRPMLSDLKETGAAEEVADIVLMLYRDEYYNQDSEKRGIAEVLIRKGRDVGTGTIELAFLPQMSRFANLEKWRG